jgi:RNA 3'-terminal phosphate cyclase
LKVSENKVQRRIFAPKGGGEATGPVNKYYKGNKIKDNEIGGDAASGK